MAGKGDTRRPRLVSWKQFEDNWKGIQWKKCSKHPEYKGVNPPRTGCQECNDVFNMKFKYEKY